MNREITITLLITALLLAAAGWLGDHARRRAPLAWHAHLPWNAATFIGLTLAILSAGHLLTLLREP
ncbi:hypothetical protein GCM10007973_06110 [Polymorphobacter multimanifer]|uniref:Uncharacterized protein n=1 Tax=Polymorphobacter multimanifer TaxID=1070431 RepID=A0A841L8E9_9SPHN|nr:hypothetical protein [Polymorphobacter multimanifer]MBB6226125.1 hypothetical protein [Polymorphobacter multimanifer]GGI71893.1 hypothetical protein GCM10007973_06110 [Polymorphobacter multimanifer]